MNDRLVESWKACEVSLGNIVVLSAVPSSLDSTPLLEVLEFSGSATEVSELVNQVIRREMSVVVGSVALLLPVL